MKYERDMSMIKERKLKETHPEGCYDFLVEVKEEKYSKDGDPMILIYLHSIDKEKDYFSVQDRILIPDDVTRQILGRTQHFLHCIDEVYDNVPGSSCIIDTENWHGKMVRAEIIHEAPNQFHKYTKAVVKQYLLPEQTIEEKLEFKEE